MKKKNLFILALFLSIFHVGSADNISIYLSTGINQGIFQDEKTGEYFLHVSNPTSIEFSQSGKNMTKNIQHFPEWDAYISLQYIEDFFEQRTLFATRSVSETMPADFSDLLARIESQKGQLLILPAFLTEDTENPPIFQKESTLYDDGVFFGGLKSISCRDGSVQNEYVFFDKIGTPQNGQFRTSADVQKEEAETEQIHQTKIKELLQEAGVCENFISPPRTKITVKNERILGGKALDVSKLGANVWMDFVVGRNRGVGFDEKNQRYFLELSNISHTYVYNLEGIHHDATHSGNYTIDLSHMQEDFQKRKQGHEDFADFEDFIEKLNAQKGKNMIFWQNEFFAPRIEIDAPKKEIKNFQFPSIDTFQCQGNRIESRPFAYFMEMTKPPLPIQNLASQYYLDGPIAENYYERSMHDELVSVMLGKQLYCQREQATQAIMDMLFQRMGEKLFQKF